MLRLINAERVRAGLDPVVLGDNVAAQLHAEAQLENCFSSHWGIDGLKPYMRYSLAGGYQSNAENASGLDYCYTRADRVRPIASIEQEIREAMEGWMESPGHRDNILDPWHRKVNIGLAWDRYNFSGIQHFEGDYVEYNRLPSIENGIITVSGTVKNGATFDTQRDFAVHVYYDRPPHALTRGQVARTYCYGVGVIIASLREPLTLGWFYDEDEFTVTETYESCPDPYDVPVGMSGPSSPDEAHEFWQAAYDASQTLEEQTVTARWITALEWTAVGERFSAKADLNALLRMYGDGVYTIVVWDTINGEDVIISEYSLFHGVTLADTYD